MVIGRQVVDLSLKPSWSTQSKQKAPHGSLVFAAFRETRGETDKKRAVVVLPRRQ